MRNRPARHRRYALATMALTLGLGVGLTPGTAGASGLIPHSTQALTDTNRGCDGVASSTPTKTTGLAVMVETPRFGRIPASLGALVAVGGATPHATYDVRIIQEGPDGLVGSCTVVVGKITTDARGNGLTLAATPVLDGATNWWIDLNNRADFTDFVDTDLMPIS